MQMNRRVIDFALLEPCVQGKQSLGRTLVRRMLDLIV